MEERGASSPGSLLGRLQAICWAGSRLPAGGPRNSHHHALQHTSRAHPPNKHSHTHKTHTHIHTHQTHRERCLRGTASAALPVGKKPESALEGVCGEAGVDEDVVGHESRPLLEIVEEHSVQPLQTRSPDQQSRWPSNLVIPALDIFRLDLLPSSAFQVQSYSRAGQCQIWKVAVENDS